MIAGTLQAKAFTPRDTRQGSLLLIKAGYPIAIPFGAQGMVPVWESHPHITMQPDAARMMCALAEAAGTKDEMIPISGYRPRAEQAALYDEVLRTNGAAFAQSYVAKPGCSEHESGLALDLGQNLPHIDPVCPHLPSTGVFKAFRQLAPDYGYIQRYPKGKEAITGIACEPWHFRYVGYPHSKIMAKHGWVLEEYLTRLEAHTGVQNALHFAESGRNMLIFTHRPNPAGSPVALPPGMFCQSAGNNAGGVVVTLWQ